MLPFEQSLGPTAVWLLHQDDVIAVRSFVDLYQPICERFEHAPCRTRIALLRGNNPGIRFGASYRALADFIEGAQHVLTVNCRIVEARLKREKLIVDNIAQMPRATGPGLYIVPTFFLRVVPERMR